MDSRRLPLPPAGSLRNSVCAPLPITENHHERQGCYVSPRGSLAANLTGKINKTAQFILTCIFPTNLVVYRKAIGWHQVSMSEFCYQYYLLFLKEEMC